jgi:hypothetical protein
VIQDQKPKTQNYHVTSYRDKSRLEGKDFTNINKRSVAITKFTLQSLSYLKEINQNIFRVEVGKYFEIMVPDI